MGCFPFREEELLRFALRVAKRFLQTRRRSPALVPGYSWNDWAHPHDSGDSSKLVVGIAALQVKTSTWFHLPYFVPCT